MIPVSHYINVLLAYVVFVTFLLIIRHKKRPALVVGESSADRNKFGHLALVVANVALVGGAIVPLLVGASGKENEYWAGMAATFIVGPVAVTLAMLGLALIFAAGCSWRVQPHKPV